MAKAKRKTKATKVKAKKSKKKIAAKPAKRAKARPKHKFTVSHHREEDFDHGLRPYSAYRDLGIAPATGGMVQAHVIRMTKPFTAEEVAIPHYHDVDFQMVYVLQGLVPERIRRPGRTYVSRRLMLDPAAQDQAHRARLL